MTKNYEKLYWDEIAKLSPELQLEFRSTIASAEFEVEEFSFKEKYEMITKVAEILNQDEKKEYNFSKMTDDLSEKDDLKLLIQYMLEDNPKKHIDFLKEINRVSSSAAGASKDAKIDEEITDEESLMNNFE